MPKNPKPLKILVAWSVRNQLWVEELRAQGHEVIPMDPAVSDEPDLILGPTCCRFVPGMEAFLPAILKGVRKVKYPGKKHE